MHIDLDNHTFNRKRKVIPGNSVVECPILRKCYRVVADSIPAWGLIILIA